MNGQFKTGTIVHTVVGDSGRERALDRIVACAYGESGSHIVVHRDGFCRAAWKVHKNKP
jgi:hypothetical protein